VEKDPLGMMIKYCVRNINGMNITYPTSQYAGKTSDALKTKVVNFVRLNDYKT
jgi:hypothetical protein